MQAVVLNGILQVLQESIVGVVGLLPTVIGAVLIVLLGLYFGRKLQPTITDAGRRVELDEKVRETPFEALFPDGSDGVSRTFSILVKYYVAAIGVVVAVEWFMIRTAGSSWYTADIFQDILGYVPPILLGIVVLFVGFYLANWAADEVRHSPVTDQFGFSPMLSGATKALLYFVVLVIGLDTMGIDVTILHTFARAFAYAAGFAIALAVGIAFGWGGKDYVAENIDDWLERSKDAATDSTAVASDD